MEFGWFALENIKSLLSNSWVCSKAVELAVSYLDFWRSGRPYAQPQRPWVDSGLNPHSKSKPMITMKRLTRRDIKPVFEVEALADPVARRVLLVAFISWVLTDGFIDINDDGVVQMPSVSLGYRSSAGLPLFNLMSSPCTELFQVHEFVILQQPVLRLVYRGI